MWRTIKSSTDFTERDVVAIEREIKTPIPAASSWDEFKFKELKIVDW